MKKVLKTIAFVFLTVLLSSCDPGFQDTYVMKNELRKEVKVIFLLNGVKDTTSIGPDVDRIVMVNSGIGLSQFDYTDGYLDDAPVIIFEDSILYEVNTTADWDLIRTFEKTMFRKSCWEILSADDKYHKYEVLYRITEEDYQNALILKEN